MDERTLFHDQWATVTTSSVVTAGATYAVANIESVAVRELRGNAFIRAIGLLLLLVGFQFFTCTGCLIAAAGGQNPYVLGGSFLAASAAWFALAPLMTRRRHAVFIGLGGQQKELVYSLNATWAAGLVAAISTAIASKGWWQP